MRTIFVLFDSLNRLALSPYGGDVATPNFQRLADRGVTFDRHYSASLPCVPARRDMQTGRANFFHRSWGPSEPFDRSVCEELRKVGVYSHLVTDHYHYFRAGGATYHTRYNSWEFIRGQENDPWKALVDPPLAQFAQDYAAQHYDPSQPALAIRKQHMINHTFYQDEADHVTKRCFDAGFAFLDSNREADNWLLQLELFDPHEPFHVPDRFREAGDSDWQGPVLDWPPYKRVDETPEEIGEIRANYRALLRMCDEYLGRLLDYMDAHDMWADTVLVMTTDHGFLLGEHEWWGKGRMPYYEELVHIPLILCHPDAPRGTRSAALTQTTDIMPTLLDIFGAAPPAEVTGRSILPDARGEAGPPRIGAFGYFAGPVGVTDGRYVLMHYAPDLSSEGLSEYTLMPQHMTGAFSPEELRTATLSPPFDFTQGMPVLRVDAMTGVRRPPGQFSDAGFRLFDLATDPGQNNPIRDADVEARLYTGLRRYMQAHDAPSEYYTWLGVEGAPDSRNMEANA